MLANLSSWSRIVGTSKSGSVFDIIVLHVLVPRNTCDNKNLRITGFPVEYREVKIPFSKWNVITGVPFKSPDDISDFLSDHVGSSVELDYNITTYNGVVRAFISKVEF